MRREDKLTEFVTVLFCALLVGAGLALSVQYLEGTARSVALIGLVILTVLLWQYLRRRFGRNQ